MGAKVSVIMGSKHFGFTLDFKIDEALDINVAVDAVEAVPLLPRGFVRVFARYVCPSDLCFFWWCVFFFPEMDVTYLLLSAWLRGGR